MKCIFYEKRSGIIAGKIIGLLKASAAGNKTELYHSIRTLSQRLTRPIDGLAIMVLIAGDRKDLLNILAIIWWDSFVANDSLEETPWGLVTITTLFRRESILML